MLVTRQVSSSYLKGSYQRKEKDSHSERWWISSIFTSPCCSLNSSSSKQNSVVMDLMRRVYLTQQEMLKFMKEKQQDSLSPDLRKYYEARQDMNDWLEKDDVPEDTKATIYAQQLQRVNRLKN